MKNAILIVVALITLQVTAQNRMKAHKGGEDAKRAFVKDLTPEEMATLKTKKMTLHLDLTEAQQTKVKAIVLEQAKIQKDKMEARQERMNSETPEKRSKEERLKLMNERLDHQIEMKQKMKAVLNAEQFEKWEQTQTKRKGKIKKRIRDKQRHKKH